MRLLVIASIIISMVAPAAVAGILQGETTSSVNERFARELPDYTDLVNVSEINALKTQQFVLLLLAGAAILLMAVGFAYKQALDKKIEDEMNEIKEFNQKVVDELTHIVKDQAQKDIFQTLSQGQRPIAGT